MVKRPEAILTVTASEFPQMGLAKGEDRTVKIKGAIPGQTLRVRMKKKKTHFTGQILEILEKSPLETEASCPAFGRCGGCLYQTLSYETENQLQWEQLKKLYREAFPETQTLPLTFHPSPKAIGYRNKMEYSFGDEEKDGPLTLGLHEKGRFFSILDTTGCTIAPDDFEKIRSAVQAYFREKQLSHYHKMRKEGFLRYLMLREGGNTKEILVNLFTTSQGTLDEEEFKTLILSLPLEGRVTGILHTIYDGIGDVTGCDEERILYGNRTFMDRLLGLDFEISPYSFFQTNSRGAEVLYQLVLDFAGDFQDKKIFDLYSGTGTMAQIFAGKAKIVEAVEIVEEAVVMARKNAARNGLKNIHFHVGDVMKYLEKIQEKPDLIILDPPREGVHAKSLEKIVGFEPKALIYVSCNPVTHVRDLKVLKDAGYTLERLEFVDMFPRTPNAEAVALLKRR